MRLEVRDDNAVVVGDDVDRVDQGGVLSAGRGLVQRQQRGCDRDADPDADTDPAGDEILAGGSMARGRSSRRRKAMLRPTIATRQSNTPIHTSQFTGAR